MLRAQPESNSLIFFGKFAWLYAETLRTIKELELSNSVILTGYVPQADLPGLYSGALCFVYPSYFEGFGLPPLEAMKCGAPVVVGNKTSLPEIVGDAGILVDPFDVDEILQSEGSLVSIYSAASREGLERSRLFDWQETARRTLTVYKKAAESIK